MSTASKDMHSRSSLRVASARIIDGPSLAEIYQLMEYKRRNRAQHTLPFDVKVQIRLAPEGKVFGNPNSGFIKQAQATARVRLIDFTEGLKGCEDFMIDLSMKMDEFSFLISSPGYSTTRFIRKIGKVELRYNTKLRTGMVKNIAAFGG